MSNNKSKWKGFFLKKSLIKTTKQKVYVWNRSSSIPSRFKDKDVWVYNGKYFKKIRITRQKIGFKFGEFSSTKISLQKKKYANKAKKKLRKK
jgi:ribosomal protein S19